MGALGNVANRARGGGFLAAHRRIPAVVDTPMLPTLGGAKLIDARALATMRACLVPRAAVLTVNALEAERLAGGRVTTLSEAHDAAIALVRMGARAVLVKGGHLQAERDRATDVLATKREVIELRAKPLALATVHGTGCALASLIAGRIAAKGDGVEAVRWAKRVHHAALGRAVSVGGKMRVMAL